MRRLKDVLLSLSPLLWIRSWTLISVCFLWFYGGEENLIAVVEAMTPAQIRFWIIAVPFLMAYLWGYILLVPILLRLRKRKDGEISGRQVVIWVILHLLNKLLLSALCCFLIDRWSLSRYTWAEMSELLNAGFIRSVVIAPIIEEYLFRDRTYFYARKMFKSEWAPIVYQALLFATAHMNMYQGVCSFLSGILFGCCYKRTENLKLCILLHAVGNVLGFL